MSYFTDKNPVQIIAGAIEAIANCQGGSMLGRQKTLATKLHRDVIDIVMSTAPSGAGLNSGTTFAAARSHLTRLEFGVAYQHMTENGFYDGWTQHTIVVTPVFCGIAVRVTGRDRNDIKEYLADTFDHWLTHALHAAYVARIDAAHADFTATLCQRAEPSEPSEPSV